MEGYVDRPASKRFDTLKKGAARLFLASVIATGLGDISGGNEVEAQVALNGLERYGKIVIYNATEEEGGIRGYAGIANDPKTGQSLLCTVEHVAEEGPLVGDIFTERKSGGDDPIVCAEVDEDIGSFEDAPEISTEDIETGDVVAMADRERNATKFVVTRVEDNKIWFTPKNQDNWVPGSGDSGSTVGSPEGERALGVYGGQSIQPNINNPSKPLVEYFMVPFQDEQN